MLKAKIHRATVTGADIDYEGSVAIDSDLLDAAELAEHEAVHIWNIANGQRIETYAITAPRGSREIRLNGAAARLFHPGDLVIITSFCWLDESQMASHRPKVVLMDEGNRIGQVRP